MATPMRKCKQCERNRSERFFTSSRGNLCESCRKKNRSNATHAARIEKTYGLSAAQYQELLEFQGGVCGICEGVRKYRLNVDHDHVTGLVRALLCRRCNKLLRDVRDTRRILLAAAEYLENPPAKRAGIVAKAEEVE